VEGLAPLDGKASFAERAYQEIRKAVLDGRLSPGAHLSVPDLAQRLGVSRSPVREAVARLEREGLAVSSPHRGAVVAPMSGEDLRQLYDLREALEGLAARLAASNAADEELTELQQRWERHAGIVEQGDIDQHVGADLAFHARVAEFARNRRLREMLGLLTAQIRVALYSTAAQPGNPQLAIREHRALLDALLQHDPDLAEQRARAHVQRVKAAIPADLGGRVEGP
jgi:DNA-binding GntR family transcriptional regulator